MQSLSSEGLPCLHARVNTAETPSGVSEAEEMRGPTRLPVVCPLSITLMAVGPDPLCLVSRAAGPMPTADRSAAALLPLEEAPEVS